MATAKKEEFSIRHNEMASLAKALSHPARIAILEILLKRESCIRGELVEDLPLSQSTISQHLKELKKAGLISGNIEGVKTCYCIDGKAVHLAFQKLTKLFNQVSHSCC